MNLAFTGFILFASVMNNHKNFPFLYIISYNIILFVPAWINNFLLFPALDRNKNILQYGIAAGTVFLVSVLILGLYLNYLYDHFSSSMLVDFTPVAVSASAPEIPENAQGYFDAFPGILIMMSIMAAGYSVQRFFLKIKKEEQAKAEQAIAQLQLLRSQISPHYLFNVLNSLYALSLKKSEQTPDVILKISDILRYSLYESQEK